MPDRSGIHPARCPVVSRRSALKGIAGLAAAAAWPGRPARRLQQRQGDHPNTGSADRADHVRIQLLRRRHQGRVRRALTTAATATTKVQITVNTIDHNTFQNNISNYLQGTPDSLATWFAGYRLQFFAAQGLLTPDRRRLGQDRRQLQRRRQEPVQGPRRPLLHGSALQLPVGRLLQQERLRRRRATPSRPRGTTSSRWPRR